MARVKHYKLYEYQVNALTIKEGQVIYTMDTGKIFLDITDTVRIQVSNLYKITSAEKSTITPITNGIYFITDTREFQFYDGTSWNPLGAKDSLGQDIASTYIKNMGVTDGKITLTLGNGIETLTDIEIIALDDTLSVQGKAADAKATGDALAKKLDSTLTEEFYGTILGVDLTGKIIPVNRNPVLSDDGVLMFGETALLSSEGVLTVE